MREDDRNRPNSERSWCPRPSPDVCWLPESAGILVGQTACVARCVSVPNRPNPPVCRIPPESQPVAPSLKPHRTIGLPVLYVAPPHWRGAGLCRIASATASSGDTHRISYGRVVVCLSLDLPKQKLENPGYRRRDRLEVRWGPPSDLRALKKLLVTSCPAFSLFVCIVLKHYTELG